MALTDSSPADEGSDPDCRTSETNVATPLARVTGTWDDQQRVLPTHRGCTTSAVAGGAGMRLDAWTAECPAARFGRGGHPGDDTRLDMP
jgi:hypothetical protein